MRHAAIIGTVETLVLCARSSWAQELQICSVEVREALSTALRYSVAEVPADHAPERMDSKSPAIPDYNVLPRAGPILVRIYMDDPSCMLDPSVLPRSANRAFLLVDDKQLQRRARGHGDGVAY